MMKILGITGIRSDYDLLSSVYTLLSNDPSVDLRLLVGGAHLSRTYGYTIDLIRADGIQILASIETLLDSDSRASRLKTAAIMLQGTIDIVATWQPDLIIYAGDREEVWIGALLGTYLGIPTAHFYGGDHTVSGHVDNQVRHATTKLSSAHFVTLEEHRDRILALGEDPRRIFTIGNLSLDNFVNTPAMPRPALLKALGLPEEFPAYALVIFHPDPSEEHVADQYLQNIFQVLRDLGIGICVGYPNTDPANRKIIEVIEQNASKPGFFAYRNLNRTDFIALYRNANFIIGNSSSGILEAASVPLPAINVGLRQRGRHAGENVLFCDADTLSIRSAVVQAMTPDFRARIAHMKNSYGDGQSGRRAYELLKSIDFDALLLKPDDALSLTPGNLKIISGENP